MRWTAWPLSREPTSTTNSLKQANRHFSQRASCYKRIQLLQILNELSKRYLGRNCLKASSLQVSSSVNAVTAKSVYKIFSAIWYSIPRWTFDKFFKFGQTTKLLFLLNFLRRGRYDKSQSVQEITRLFLKWQSLMRWNHLVARGKAFFSGTWVRSKPGI